MFKNKYVFSELEKEDLIRRIASKDKICRISKDFNIPNHYVRNIRRALEKHLNGKVDKTTSRISKDWYSTFDKLKDTIIVTDKCRNVATTLEQKVNIVKKLLVGESYKTVLKDINFTISYRLLRQVKDDINYYRRYKKISEKSLISHDWYIATDKAIKSINNVVEMENAEMKSDEKFEQEYIVTCEKSKFVKVTGRDQVKGVLEAFSSLGLNGKIKIYEIKEVDKNLFNVDNM